MWWAKTKKFTSKDFFTKHEIYSKKYPKKFNAIDKLMPKLSHCALKKKETCMNNKI